MSPPNERPLEQMQRRKSNDAALAAARLGRVLVPATKLPSVNLSPGRVGDVIGIVAERLNFEPRPVTLDPHQPLLHQARLALQASQVRTRSLTLNATWWQRNVPTMVVVHEGQLAVVMPGPLFAPYLHRVEADPLPVTAEVAAGIEFEALEVIPPLPDRAVTVGELLRMSLVGTRRDMVIAVLASLGVGVISLTIPAATSLIFGAIVPTGSEMRLLVIVVALVLAGIASACLAYTCTYHLIRIGDSVEAISSGALIDRVLRLPASALRQWSSAELSARILVASSIQDALTQGVTIGILSVVVAALNGALLVALVPSLGFIALVAGVLVIVMVVLMVRRENSLMIEELARKDELDDVTLGIMRGWTPLRMTDGEVAAFGRWAQAFASFRLAFNQRWGVGIAVSVVTAGILSGAVLVFVLVAYTRPVGSVDSSAFVAFVSAFGQFAAGITGISITLSAFARIRPAVARLRPLLDVAPEVEVQREDPGELKGDLEVRRLSFRYSDELPWVLRDVTFSAPAGSFVGIVGTSGSGKSTLLRLLLGFEEPRAGVVMYDQSDLASLDLGAVRRQFGVVLQSSLLLPGTLRENVMVSSGPLTDARIWELLDRVDVGDSVREMPLGLDTVVDEGSTILSGGQRQRILLARALANEPAVLFLDEATSALDNVTQEAVTRNVSELGVTRVVIAHRLSTIREADLIVVLDGGEVAERGTYEELVAMNGLFASLVERQEL